MSRKGAGDYAYRELSRRTIHVVRDRKDVIVFDAAVTLSMTDAPAPRRPMLELDVTVAANVVTVDDHGACRGVKPEPKCVGKPLDCLWSDFDHDQFLRLCRGVGTYRWKAGRFQLSPGRSSSS